MEYQLKICLNAFTLHYGIMHWLFQNSITRAWYEDRAQKYCTLCIMHARWCFDHARWFRYRNCIVRFLYILRAKLNISITLCFVLCPSWIVHCFGSRILNRTNSCYELQMIDIVPWYSTLLQYCNTGSRSLSFDDRIFLDMTINLFHIHNSKVSTRHMILH